MAKASRGGKIGASSSGAGGGGQERFRRTDIPIMRTRNDDKSQEIQYVKGYTMAIDGQNINLQKLSDGYALNINGYLAGAGTWRTLNEAKEEAPKRYVELMKTQNFKNQLEYTGAIMDEIKKRGGSVSSSEIKKIKKNIRDNLRNT